MTFYKKMKKQSGILGSEDATQAGCGDITWFIQIHEFRVSCNYEADVIHRPL